MRDLLKIIKSWFVKSKESNGNSTVGLKNTSEPRINVRRYRRQWCYPEEKPEPPIAISLPDKPDERFLLVEDKTPGYWSVHFCTTSPDSLTEDEKNIMFSWIANRIPKGDKLSSHGYITPGGLSGLRRFKKLGFKTTGETRLLKSKADPRTIITINILQKLW